jgi:hypothetical protein
MWLPRVYIGVEWHCIRPRFTVRSLMVVVAAAGLILALVAYEQRLTTQARYHEIKYLEYITPVSLPARGIIHKAMLLDGTWSVPHHKTPQAEWHERKKWGYHRAIVQTNFLVIATLVGSICLWFVGKIGFGRSQRVRRDRQAMSTLPSTEFGTAKL